MSVEELRKDTLPRVCFDEQNKELGLKILDRVIASIEKEIEDEKNANTNSNG